MSEVVSFKVPREIKEKMRRYSGRIRWSEELRRFVAERIKELEREENLTKVVETIGSTRGVPRGFSAGAIREDRDA